MSRARVRIPVRSVGAIATAGIASLAGFIGPSVISAAADSGESAGLRATTILSGASLIHTFTDVNTGMTSQEHLTKPDDLTRLGRDIYIGFQNGVGPQGEASGSGNADSTVVEMTTSGQWVAQWDIVGKTDGVTADPEADMVIATVNEDAGSSLYTITPGSGGGVHHYSYNEALPHLGGTDAISVFDGHILISASAPGATGTPMQQPPQPTFPAVYSVTLDPSTSIATVSSVFHDEDPATVATAGPHRGQTVNLALTDPDSTEVVPQDAHRFAGDFMLTSQGDQEQIFLSHLGPDPKLWVLSLTQSVDDTSWPSEGGTLYATDSTNDSVDAVTGHFPDSSVAVATPCGSNAAPSPCPASGFPANYLASLNSASGHVTALSVGGVPFIPQGGLLFVGDDQDQQGHR